jgi:hypothetical protein
MKLYLNTKELAARWGCEEETIRQWRWLKKGPGYFKLSGRASYHIDDIKQYEEGKKHNHTTRKAKKSLRKDK